MHMRSRLPLAAALILIGGCVSLPTGPSVLVLPGTGKTFEQFRMDDANCRQYAYAQIGGTTPGQAAASSGLASAAIGTALGAATGAAIGGGRGAAVGAGTGLAVGGLTGTGMASDSYYGLQERYNFGYIQCMYASGHRVPVPGEVSYSPGGQPPSAPPPPPPSSSSSGTPRYDRVAPLSR